MGTLAGHLFAALSALITVFVIFVFPLWSIAVLTLDCLVLYGLSPERVVRPNREDLRDCRAVRLARLSAPAFFTSAPILASSAAVKSVTS